MFAVVELTAYLRSAVAALLAVAAIFVAARRLAGALETPLGGFQLLAAAIVLAGLAGVAHAPLQKGRFHAGCVLISLAILVIGASLSRSGSNLVALLGFWVVVVGEELWAWRSLLPARRAISPRLPAVPGRMGEGQGVSISPLPLGEGQGVRAVLPLAPPHAPTPADGDSIEEFEPVAPAADVLQQLTLRTTAEGGQELSGWLRLWLAKGQRTGSLHVAFCPSFDELPQVQAEAVSGPGCRIKAAQVLPYGARLDVKLDEPAAEDESVLVWFFARSEG
jgi:hypothetical protein